MINQIKSTFLLTIMTLLIVGIGYTIGGRSGMTIAFIFAAGMNFFSYWYSDKIVLKMYRAQEASPDQFSDIHNMVSQLAQEADLPMPKVFIIPDESPNAFATGRNPQNAVIAVTQGLMRIMNREEIKGVLAHELAHVKNRDILVGSIAATMAGAIMLIATMARWSAFLGGGNDDEEGGLGTLGLIIMSILAPLAAIIIQMAISRSREYLADETGARFAGHPNGLAGALEKLGKYSSRIPMDANPSTAHMFIVNPLSGRSLMSLFSTHPPLENRIARLQGTPPSEKNRGISDARSSWDRISR